MSINFKKEVGAYPYHETSTQKICITTNHERAENYNAEEPMVIKIHADRFPKEINKLKKQIRYVLKEAGTRNFLVVLNEGSNI